MLAIHVDSQSLLIYVCLNAQCKLVEHMLAQLHYGVACIGTNQQAQLSFAVHNSVGNGISYDTNRMVTVHEDHALIALVCTSCRSKALCNYRHSIYLQVCLHNQGSSVEAVPYKGIAGSHRNISVGFSVFPVSYSRRCCHIGFSNLKGHIITGNSNLIAIRYVICVLHTVAVCILLVQVHIIHTGTAVQILFRTHEVRIGSEHYLTDPAGSASGNGQVKFLTIGVHKYVCGSQGDLRLSAGYLEGLTVQGNSCGYFAAEGQVQIVSVPLSTEFHCITHRGLCGAIQCSVSIVFCKYFASGCGCFGCTGGNSKVAGESDQHCQHQQ